MINLIPKRNILILLMVSLSLGFASCTGGKSAVDTTWSLAKLVSVGNPIENSSIEIVEVKNCGIPIEKTTDCSAGTSNDLSLTLNSGGAFGVGSQFIIESSVGTTLGIGQQSGQSVKLPNPSDGFIYTYTVSKNYRIVNGQAVARSSNGEEQVVNFNFHASCSIDIVDREQSSCSGNSSVPNNQLPDIQQSSQTKFDGWVICWHGKFDYEYLIAYPESMLEQGLDLSILLPQPWGGGTEYLPNDSLKMCLYNGIWYGEQSTPWFPYASYIIWQNDEFLVCQDSPSCNGKTWVMKSVTNPPYMQALLKQPTGSNIEVIGYK